MPELPSPINSPAVRVEITPNGILPEYIDGESYEAWASRLAECFGTESQDVAEIAVRSVAQALKKGDSQALNAIIAQVREMKPSDALETCLILQSLLVSNKAMELMAEAQRSTFDEDKERKLAASASFMRLFINQLAALKRYRSKSEQHICVTHVQANQAIIGNVTTDT